ncbi:20088_t:CDS:2 [Rhizophagus irregularis]|nr:20088_t:CDS:2 [Rhizophagus irregularis]
MCNIEYETVAHIGPCTGHRAIEAKAAIFTHFKSTASGQFAQKINWNFWTSEEFSSIFQDAIKGKIDASMTNKASKLFNFTRNKCITFCTKLLTIMVTQIFIEWWTPRCRLTVQWESTNGISTSMNLNEKIGGTLIKPAERFARSLRKMMDQAGLFAHQNR